MNPIITTCIDGGDVIVEQITTHLPLSSEQLSLSIQADYDTIQRLQEGINEKQKKLEMVKELEKKMSDTVIVDEKIVVVDDTKKV